MLWVYTINVNYVVVRGETGIKSIYDLSGKKLNISPLHAGAVRYYRELGFKVPDHLVPPEAK